jgi:AcrR family transcriptional regulator
MSVAARTAQTDLVGLVREDRRVGRTRRLLQEALRALILEKGYDHVTVQNVIDRADVARATFYAHYRDKDDLLLHGFEGLWNVVSPALEGFAEAEHAGAASGGPLPPSRALVRHVAEHRALYRAFVRSRAGPLILKRVRERLAALTEDHLRAKVARQPGASGTPGTPVVPVDILAEFAVSGLLGVLTWWLDDSSPYDADELATLCERLMAPAMGAAVSG